MFTEHVREYKTHSEEWEQNGSVIFVKRDNSGRYSVVRFMSPDANVLDKRCTLVLTDVASEGQHITWRLTDLKQRDALTLARAWVRGN